MSLFFLAFRNIVRSLDRRWPLVVILAVCTFVLTLGNALFDSVSSGLERTYVNSLSGNLSISARGEEPFTLLGNQLPIIGEYDILPLLPNANGFVHMAQQAGLTAIEQVTSQALLSWNDDNVPLVALGVDFASYFLEFPSLKVLSSVSQEAGGEIYLNETQFEHFSHLNPPVKLGDVLTVSVFNDHSFTIRPVRVVGVYRYPVSDEVLNRVVLVDPDTARALNGYVQGGRKDASQANVGYTSNEIDDLFSDGGHDKQTTVTAGLTSGEVTANLQDSSARKQLNQTDEGAWNFVLVRGEPSKIQAYQKSLAGQKDLQVRDWRETVGGYALLVGLIQVLFNVGLLFVVLGVVMVTINSLSLSVVERTKEWGTIRALGGSRSVVAGLVLLESLLVVGGSGLIGSLAATAFVGITHESGFAVTNEFLRSLFGTSILRPTLSVSASCFVVLFSLLLGILSSWSPISRVLAISPEEAMGKE